MANSLILQPTKGYGHSETSLSLESSTMIQRLADIAKTRSFQWIQKHREAIFWMLLVVAFIAVMCRVFIALPLAFAGITAEALLVKRVRARKRTVARAEQPFEYWAYVAIWTWAMIYSALHIFK